MAIRTITNGVFVSEDFFPVFDQRNQTQTNIDEIRFNTTEATIALFRTSQIGVGAISPNAIIRGDAQENFLIFQLQSAGTYDFDAATNFTLTDWTAGVDYLVLLGTGGANTIWGSDAAEYINGEFDQELQGDSNSGNDVLHGRGGSDVLEGWGGRDEVYGEGGNDTLVAFEDDVLTGEVFSGGNGRDTLLVTTGSTTDLRGVTLSSIEVMDVSGWEAFATSTTILSGTQIGGGALSSTLAVIGYVDQKDIISIFAGAGNVDVSGWTFTDWQLRDTVRLTGDAGANTLIGSSRSDVIVGGAGADVINGGAGRDTLTGNIGADDFVFDTAPVGALSDTINDFVHGVDQIHLDNDIFTALGAPGFLKAPQFWIGSSAHDANDRIIYNDDSGAVIYDSNGNGVGGDVVIATLSTGLALTSADFVIF